MTSDSWAYDHWSASNAAAANSLKALCGMELDHEHSPLVSGAVSGEPWKYTVGRGTRNYVALHLRPCERPWALVAGRGAYATLSSRAESAIPMMLFEGEIFRAGRKYAAFVDAWPQIEELILSVEPSLDLEALRASVMLPGWGDIRGYDYLSPAVQDGFAHHLSLLDPNPDRTSAVRWGRKAIADAAAGRVVDEPPEVGIHYRPYVHALAFRLLPDCGRRREAAFFLLTRSITQDTCQPVEGTLWPTPNVRYMRDLVHRASEYLATFGLPSDAREHPLASVVCRIHEDIEQVHSDPYLAASAELAGSDPQASWDHLMMAGVFAKFADAPMSVLENFIGAAAALAARLGDDELAELYRSS